MTSNLKVLRGSFARQLFYCAKNGKKLKTNRVFPQQCIRSLATQTAPSLDNKCLSSPWGEIQVGSETLTDYVFSDFELWADKPSLTCGISGRSYDYGMMRLMIERCASALLAALRLAPGDRLGLILPNLPEFAVLIHGAMRAGLVVTFANPLYTAEEMKRQFSDCQVKAIATIEMFMPIAEEVSKALKDYKGTIWVGGEDDSTKGIFGLRSLLMADHAAELPTLNPDDLCLIPYSSGTTGMPKGVMLTHKNLVTNLKQVLCPKIMKYGGEKGKGDVVLTVPPFFHIYGFNGILNYNLKLGYHIISMPKFTPDDYIKCLVQYKPTTLFVVPSLLAFLGTHPMVTKDHLQSVETIEFTPDDYIKCLVQYKPTTLFVVPSLLAFLGTHPMVTKDHWQSVETIEFTPDDYIKCLVQYKPTTLFVVPSLLAFLGTHPMVTKDHLQSVETIMVGAAPTTDSILEKFLLKCQKTKDQVRLLQGYGMTESSPVSLMTPYVYPHSKVGSVGQLICSTQGRVVSLTDGRMLGPHESGELWVRGPQVMKGYWNNEAATKETVDAEGWLHTGDVAYYDEEHYFYIVDRTKELIKVKGNQVSPTEIESIVMEMPEVADVAVVGMPDHLAGELPKAFVVQKPRGQLTEKQVYDFVAQKLTKYKHLEGGVVFLDAIPRNAAGKIMRNELKVLGRKK